VRRPLGTLAAAALGVLTLASSAIAASGISVAPIKGPKYPERAFVVHVPEAAAVSRPRVRVRENGGRVKDVGVVPANLARQTRRGLVLVVDASNSMRGAPIRAAMVAARTLAARRTSGQRIAVVTFNSRSTIRLRPTGDSAVLAAALEPIPRLAQGTHFYDALDAALAMAAETGMRSPTIVLLSDGADTGSRASAVEIVRKARQRGARFFTVGLQNVSFEREPLEQLARATGGTFAAAKSAAELEPVFDRLGYQLANEYVVEYLSLAGPEEKVRVDILVEGVGSASESYVTPALPVVAASALDSSSTIDDFWSSSATMFFVALATAALLAVAGVLFVRPRNRLFRKRMAEFVTVAAGAGGDAAPRTALPDRVFGGAERSLSRLQVWGRFKEELQIAEIKMPAVQIVLWTVVATIVVLWVLNAVAGMPIALAGFGVPLLVRTFLKFKLNRRRNAFAEQLPENLQVLGSALRAGHSLVGALSVVVTDAPEPARSEFQRVVADEQLGVPLEDSLMEVARRMDSKDLEQVALVAAVGRQTGGNQAEVLDQVTRVVRERFELRRLVAALTAQGRLSNWVLSLLPLALLIIISIVNPGYMDPLLDAGTGRAMLFLAGLMILAGSLIIRKIVNIRV
jgi:tight adherence protein B